jgi:hypothetical protein
MRAVDCVPVTVAVSIFFENVATLRQKLPPFFFILCVVCDVCALFSASAFYALLAPAVVGYCYWDLALATCNVQVALTGSAFAGNTVDVMGSTVQKRNNPILLFGVFPQ